MVLRVLPKNHTHQPIRILLKFEVRSTDHDCKRGIFRGNVVKIIAIRLIKVKLLRDVVEVRPLDHIVQNVH